MLRKHFTIEQIIDALYEAEVLPSPAAKRYRSRELRIATRLPPKFTELGGIYSKDQNLSLIKVAGFCDIRH